MANFNTIIHTLKAEWQAERLEYARPWKLLTLAIGLLLLIIGNFIYRAPDWDIPISIIMAVCAYLTAGWSLRVILFRRWRWFGLMLFFTWFCVDGNYFIYWYFTDPFALETMRSANAPASLSLYWMCGLVWLYKGTLKQFRQDASKFISRG